MILNKLYSEPLGLFETVKFINGVNFIFAKKDKNSDPGNSLNGVGKSLLLNFLDYALLSSKTKHIKSAMKNNEIGHYSIALEFTIQDSNYVIKRSLMESSKNIVVGKTNDPIYFESIKEAKEYLCDLIFKNEDYKGKYHNTWLRKLLPFFIKKQENPKTKVNFLDPIKFSISPEMELIPYHLFFLGIDNSLFWKNFDIKSDLKNKIEALKEIRSIITDTYNLHDIPQAENKIDRLKGEVQEHETNIEKFQLAKQYQDIEKESNNLTVIIKDLWYQNHLDLNKVKSYKESYELDDSLQTLKIKKLYTEANELLAGNIKKTLDDAVLFRKNIADSRKEFLSSEIKNIEIEIKKRKNKIDDFELERAKIFKFLETRDAIKDLSEAYLNLSKKREKLNDLEGKIKLYQDLNSEKAEREAEIAKLYSEITNFIQEIKNDISIFRKIFFEVHNAIYPENKDKSYGFTFEPKPRADSKVNMEVFLPADLSTGKNSAKTLIYDISVLFHAIERDINLPHFLIHDGIFDHMDKAHFIAVYEYLEKKARSETFQYILTVNEEGTLSDEFGNADKVNPQKIEQEAILTLTPSNRLLGSDWG
ncbi:hypothetical protein SCALIN_C27_0022 [Candidatus Scalindua japonica]|uniref:DUF2326 domain-containing protein n=1 Tax=Candidatus Scalindua japonica TaxID=1284222 RepID=A0A286U0J3_9BACT|nr:DUF2326 domain-containing protein [Candidatus Scalindua japonica]GAX61628.1 hypothetical protein SCALIN_C27_0022 [Candidatus Scalindua japonica]